MDELSLYNITTEELLLDLKGVSIFEEE